ncbi:Kdo domain containing protein [Flavobacterium gawalongense]|uniref:Kdo domain containing protein n=2 Tax=Flavobacterium gawalongense TaxID=2594432 RepID=A0A553BV40_9FLAO|nr:lipopolysaccharide kinase InaA family protein [Flavobacterium gawalongense]TRX02778.1 Kdo domain containing protein [Flavobacterium gawalongense]TRX08086.1 Kdo domain containing protein [Flavobacterium gawalongense]TRX11364.1 Kdo domain containing protein [Flavobacterium gawalongense]TRX12124.1 Kdo domain containing protein [Flavobacterium gawalongense]TRX28999.1 Kdo domain containing protein [Flavobacterium gawalongense]
MQINIHPNFLKNKSSLLTMIENFDTSGVLFGDGKRNKIKLFDLEDKTINIKSFKIPNIVNQVAYKYFRKSKARRSYEYANKLLENGIGTPQPIAYAENFKLSGLEKSFYISEHLQAELTFRELVQNPDYPDHENILRQFTKFTFDLHEKGIEFLDHSPGNTLIKKIAEGKYNFYLVDLNRMNFHDDMDFDSRMKNFNRLTPKIEMLAVMSDEYAKLYNKEYEEVFSKICFYTNDFQFKFHRKIEQKKKLLFWR